MIKSFKIVDLLSNIYSFIFNLFSIIYAHPCPKINKQTNKRESKKVQIQIKKKENAKVSVNFYLEKLTNSHCSKCDW